MRYPRSWLWNKNPTRIHLCIDRSISSNKKKESKKIKRFFFFPPLLVGMNDDGFPIKKTKRKMMVS